jgi:iron complex transport system substrate-binding protein
LGNRSGDIIAGECDRMTHVWNRFPGARVLYAGIVLFALSYGQTTVADISLPQADGGTLNLPAPAKRIITLAPNLAELVFAAGAGDHLVAVVEYSDFPPQVNQLPKVGDAFRIDLERIIELEPDLVIAWESGNPQTALQKLTQLGLKVWQLEITEPQEIATAVEDISKAAGTEDLGMPVAKNLRQRLGNLQRQNAGKTPVTFFYQIASTPLYTVNGQHIISRSIEICGATNVFKTLSSLAPQVSRESVILANPQAMIAAQIPGESPALAVWFEWPRLQAVKDKALLYLPADDISRAAPRLLDSIELACRLLDQVRRNGS